LRRIGISGGSRGSSGGSGGGSGGSGGGGGGGGGGGVGVCWHDDSAVFDVGSRDLTEGHLACDSVSHWLG